MRQIPKTIMKCLHRNSILTSVFPRITWKFHIALSTLTHRCRQYVWLQLLWYLSYHYVMVMELWCVNTYCIAICNWVPLITVTLAAVFCLILLKMGVSVRWHLGQRWVTRGFWRWSHALWLKDVWSLSNKVNKSWVCSGCVLRTFFFAVVDRLTTTHVLCWFLYCGFPYAYVVDVRKGSRNKGINITHGSLSVGPLQ